MNEQMEDQDQPEPKFIWRSGKHFLDRGFHRFTEKWEILDVIRSVLLHKERQIEQVSFLATIRQRPGSEWKGWVVTPGGHIIEGFSPMSLSHDYTSGRCLISLTNSDSHDRCLAGSLYLDDIEYVETLYEISCPAWPEELIDNAMPENVQ